MDVTSNKYGRMILTLVVLALALVAIEVQAELSEEEALARQSNARFELWELFETSSLRDAYEVDLEHLNPYLLQGDFDGDKKVDFVVVLRAKDQPENKQMAVIRGNGEVAWLKRDDQLDYPTLESWYIHPQYLPVEIGAAGGRPPKLRGDAIMVIRLESSSSLLYWNGKRFVSYWQGD